MEVEYLHIIGICDNISVIIEKIRMKKLSNQKMNQEKKLQLKKDILLLENDEVTNECKSSKKCDKENKLF